MEYDTQLEDSEVNSKFPNEALIDVPVADIFSGMTSRLADTSRAPRRQCQSVLGRQNTNNLNFGGARVGGVLRFTCDIGNDWTTWSRT